METIQLDKFNQDALLSEIKSCFDSKELEELAHSSKFIRRSTSRLTGESFLLMNVFDTSDGKERSLNDSCDWLEEHYGISMTKQSLDERYNTDAVKYIKTCFNRVLQIVNKGVVDKKIELPFTKVQLTDSTSFRIPDHLSTFYKGYKGNGGKAILKIHLKYDFLNGCVEDIFLTDGSASDNKYEQEGEEQLLPNAMYIKDLGYYYLKRFARIDKAKAYFLSRGRTDGVYSIKDNKGKFRRINLEDYLPSSGQTKELKDIYIGRLKNKVKVRLIIQALPEDAISKRLERIEKVASRNKHRNAKISEQRRRLCPFNFFITNAPSEILPESVVRLVYTIRWQIELIFKIWKSVFNIDKVKKMSIFRFECYIYSKLIAILLTLHIHNKLGQFLWDEYDFELSPIKAAKLIKKNLMA